MTEDNAKQLVKTAVSTLLGQDDSVVIVSRKGISRLEHQAVIAVVFKHDETLEQKVVSELKNVTFKNPDLEFIGTEVNDKFNMEFVAVLVSATIKG